MATTTTPTSWGPIIKAVNETFVYGRFLPRAARKWEKKAKKLTIQKAGEFRKKAFEGIFKDLNIYYNKIMTFDSALIAKINDFSKKEIGEAGLILKHLSEEREKRLRLMKGIFQVKDPTAFIREVGTFFKDFKQELKLTQHHLKKLSKILKKTAKEEKKRASEEQKQQKRKA